MLARPTALLVLASLALASSALAGGVGNVSHSPVVVHADLQAAIDAAANGDVLMAHGGNYAGFTIDNRSLAIFAVPGETVHVQGKVEIKNLPSSKRVVLSDLDIHETIASGLDGTRALYVSNCTGPVWIQGCTLTGADGVDTGTAPDGGYGGAGVELLNATSVVLVSSTLTGGSGGDIGTTSCFPACWLPGEGGAGLWLQGSSRAALYDCDAYGGHGGNGGYEASRGGDGIWNAASSGSLFASNTSATGGDGGASVAWQDGDGGDGLHTLVSPTVSTVLGCSFSPGVGGAGSASNPGSDGVPVFGAALQLAPAAHRFLTEHVARDATSVTAYVGGSAGDSCFAPKSTTPAWLLKLATNGVWTIRYPSSMPTTPLAVLPFDGSIAVNWTTPQVPSGAQTALCFSQGYVLPASGGAVLASPACTLLLDVDAPPDCDANGVFDVLDVLEGAADVNQNFAPDACENFQTWYVDESAAPGGDGSLAAPFQTLQAGVNAAASAETVIVLDGTYIGAQNRSVDFGGKTLCVKSLNGPAACVIDCQNLGRAFHLHSGEGPATRIEGFTLRDGSMAGSAASGGAILLELDGRATIANCVFESNFSGGVGGALGVESGAYAEVRACSFDADQATQHGGAISARGDGSGLRVSACTFTGNSSNAGGAIALIGSVFLELSHSTFLANDAGSQGGAVHLEHSAQFQSCQLVASNVLFAGNRAHGFGGGAISGQGFADDGISVLNVIVHESTFVANTADTFVGQQGGGAIHAKNGLTQLVDCVLWQNVHPTAGSQIRIDAGYLFVDYCDVDGGLSDIFNSGGSANWGAGNFDVDPLFVDIDGMDNDPLTFGDNVYRLKPISPCLDAGDALDVPSDFTDIDGDLDFGELVPLDLNLKPRFTDLPSVPDTGVGTPAIDLGCYERQV